MMRFFVVDDDEAVRSMLAEIIEDYDLGEVVGEADNGEAVDGKLLVHQKVDILIIDLLMPLRDGIETVRAIKPYFNGKVIMLSQIEDKQMIGNAYSIGIANYITKPINLLEVLSIIKNTMEHIRMQKVITNIEKNLNVLNLGKSVTAPINPVLGNDSLMVAGQFLLSELGMIGENGCKDLLDILDYLYKCSPEKPVEKEFPALKDIFTSVSMQRLGQSSSECSEVKKESKAMEQRVRRAIFQGLVHLASLGVTDYSNPKFEEYAPNFFDFSEVRKIMLNIQANSKPLISDAHINVKRFVKVLFLEAKIRKV